MQVRQVMCLLMVLVYIVLVILGKPIAVQATVVTEQHRQVDQERYLQTVFRLLVSETQYHAGRVIKQAAEMSLRGDAWLKESREPKN